MEDKNILTSTCLYFTDNDRLFIWRIIISSSYQHRREISSASNADKDWSAKHIRAGKVGTKDIFVTE